MGGRFAVSDARSEGARVIKEYRSIPAWWAKRSAIMIKHFEAMGEMYYQRG